jgi:hypothetical protein
VTRCRVAAVPGGRIDPRALEELAKGRTPDATGQGGGDAG